MKTVKEPIWDKQEGMPIVLTDPDGPGRTPSLSVPLEVGYIATGTVGGVEIAVKLTEILTSSKAKGEVIDIFDGITDLDSLGDLAKGDLVLIGRQDMYSIEIDAPDAIMTE